MFEKTLEKIRESGAEKIMIQIPEGLKTRVLEIAREMEKEGLEILISCDPCYGGCDLRDREAKELGCDLLLHMGHTPFGIKTEIPVIYESYPIEFNPIPLLEKNLSTLKKYKKICLITTSQFLKTLEITKKFLEKNNIKIMIGEHKKANNKGQILGCDYTAALSQDCDCYLFLGSGKFHPLGLALKTNKSTLSLDFETGELNNFEKEKKRLEKIRAFHIGQAKEAKNFGILLTTKKGQGSLQLASSIKKKLEEKGKRAWILVMDEITPNKIMGMDLDILVNCACPRMNEDFQLFKKPILNPEDVNKL